ncbi:MAG: carboxymuconolactone decarboxylase family protein [Acidobacteria bacterium]|nr:carboxymuconolactone decarboxylase family protein [Acidobacteriota bacterium]
MARIPFADRSGLSPQTLETLEALPDIGIFRLLSQADGSFAPFAAFTASLWNDAELSPRRRELVILLVARLAGCEYEWFQHEPVARMCDITDGEIAALRELDLATFGDEERAMLELARTTFDRGRPSDAELAAARQALSDREVIELQLVVAVYAGLAAIMNGLDLELDERSGAEQLGHDERGPRLGD